jgi:hypothetical protein
LGLSLSEDFGPWLQVHEYNELSHSSKFEYSIDDYDVSEARIESELVDLFEEYGWPRQASVDS